MKHYFKKAASLILSSMISLSAFGVLPVQAADTTSCGGWFESIYASWSDSSAEDATVEYKKSSDTSYTTADSELIRQYSEGARVDIVGLSAGTYDLKITSSSGDVITKTGIEVDEYDRSGYAHFNYTDGVGAYNDDGTLKDNAIVLYVTDENKDTVTVTSKDGTTVSGIGNILNSRGAISASGSLTNTNSGIIKKLAADGTPLVVRIIGTVTAPEGLTAYDSTDYGGSEGDNGYMARMQSGKDVTIEGIGYDAEIDGWGIHYICESSATQYGKSFEVRNISFKNVPEDCIGMEGQQEGTTITAPVERCWIHNCEFYAPRISNPAESDKAGGDGACDFKRGQYFTNSYCYYEGYHKTNLVGSSNSSLQYHITYHHNYWKECESRGPLGRQANIHMYNNIFEGQSSYAMNTRANCYIFSEYNLFVNCKNPMDVDSGAIKSYNDSFSCCIGSTDGTIVTDKSEQVSSGNKYENFDTNSSISYIPSGDYELQDSIAESKKAVYAYAGTMDIAPLSADEVDSSVLANASDRIPSNGVALPYEQDLNSTYLTSKSATVDNIIFNVYKLNSDSISVGSNTTGLDIVFKVDQEFNISMTDGGASYPIILLNEDGEALLTGSGVVNNLPAGIYIIQSSGYDVGSKKYKEAKISNLTIVPVGTVLTTTTTETTTQTTTAASQATTNSDGSTETTTQSNTNVADGCVPMGTLELNKNTISSATATVNNIVFDVRSIEKSNIKLRDENTVTFTVDRNCTLETDPNSYGILIATSDGEITYNNETDTGFTAKQTASFTLTPATYVITGATSSNSTLSYFTFTSLEADDDTDTDTDTDNIYYGDASGDKAYTATDAAYIMKKAANSSYVLPIEKIYSGIDITKYFDLNGNNVIDASDAALALSKARNKDFVFPVLA